MTSNRLIRAFLFASFLSGSGLIATAQEQKSGLGDLPLSDIEAIATEAYDAGELEEAALFWSAAAKRGSVSAMVSLAVTYEEIGSHGDAKRVEIWYRAASEKGDVIAKISLAEILLNRKPAKTEEALQLLTEAAEAGNLYARDLLSNRRSGKSVD